MRKKLIVRLAVEEDVEQIYHLLQGISEFYPIDKVSLDEKNIYVVAEDSESSQIVGFATLLVVAGIRGGNFGILHELIVDPASRGKGLGKALVEKIEMLGIERRCRKILLSSGEENIYFYKRIGYHCVETAMKKDLRQLYQ